MASIGNLHDKHIEQAENYASRAGIPWALLTNGVEWRLYHRTFHEAEGIAYEVAFSFNLVGALDAEPEGMWDRLSMLCPAAVFKGRLEYNWARKKALRPYSVVKVLFKEEVLHRMARELNRDPRACFGIDDVFNAVRDVLAEEALVEAGDISISKRRKLRKKVVPLGTGAAGEPAGHGTGASADPAGHGSVKTS